MRKSARDLSLSIVIASKNRPDDVARCLASIRAQPTQPDEIIIIDQSEAKYEISDPALITHVYAPHLTGLAQARNVAAKLVGSRIVFFLDDDAELLDDCVAAVRAGFLRHPDAVGIGCQVRMPTTGTTAARVRKRLRDLLPIVFEQGFFDARPRRRARGVEIRAMTGCAMAFSASLFAREQVDERLHGYSLGEDWEFSLRARRYGTLWLAENASVMHHQSPANRWGAQRLLLGRWNNFQYFYEKHRADASPLNRVWRAWWMVGESIRWCQQGMGFPDFGSRTMTSPEKRHTTTAFKT